MPDSFDLNNQSRAGDAVPVVPPSSSEVAIRTMESDLAAMGQSGGLPLGAHSMDPGQAARGEPQATAVFQTPAIGAPSFSAPAPLQAASEAPLDNTRGKQIANREASASIPPAVSFGSHYAFRIFTIILVIVLVAAALFALGFYVIPALM